MTTQTEAFDMITKLQLAHQAMESACERIDQLRAENKALKEALAQPEQREPTKQEHNILMGALKRSAKVVAQPEQEPVAWRHKGEPWRFKTNYCINLPDVVPDSWEPLYTTPPQRTWVGLTEDETAELVHRYAFYELTRQIEAKLKEKNT